MLIAVIVLNFAYIALLASTFTRNLTWLRVALVVASIAFAVFGVLEDILSIVLWNIAIGASHLFRIVRDYRQQHSVKLTAKEQTERDEFFPELSDFDFHLLWCMGRDVHYEGQALLHAGKLPDTVSLVLEGTVVVEGNQGEALRNLNRGALVGEMSYISGTSAGHDVRAQGAVAVKQWDQRQLASLDRLHPASARAFQELISLDLVAKARL